MYHRFLGKSLIDIAVRVHMCMCGRGRSSTSLIALNVNLNKAVALCQNHLRFHLCHF